jgi:pSer/pThr/pTyr-binding forkhead associated (FHA) protein
LRASGRLKAIATRADIRAERALRGRRGAMDRVKPDVRGILVICNGGFEGMEYELSSDQTLIGRNPTTDVTLLDENISREHSVILFDEETGTYTIEDLQSSNGTKVNGKRIRSVTLADTDEIEIGNTRFRFLLKDSVS